MPRALFEKYGNAIYTSHLDLMRVFQRAFKRAGLPLTHTQGFNPRPSVSIALPLSLGVESRCELLDFDLEGEKIDNGEILRRLNDALIDGVRIMQVYDDGRKVKHLAYLDCTVTLEYDAGIVEDAKQRLEEFFAQEQILVEKKSKNGMVEQDIRPMIRTLKIVCDNANEISIHARICCQNPSLNPMLLSAAISKYLPDLTPDFARCCRIELFDHENNIFR